MSDESKCFIVTVAAIATVLVSLIIAFSWRSTIESRIYVEGGYEQRTLEGVSGVFWVKVDNPELTR